MFKDCGFDFIEWNHEKGYSIVSAKVLKKDD